MRKPHLFTLLGAFILAGALAVPAQADVTAYVVHGIDGADGLPVDVSVSGLGCVPALEGLEFGDRIGPLTVPAGNYDISVFLADDINPCEGIEVIDLDDLELSEGANATVIAHRTADGTAGPGDVLELGITASLFANDSSPVGRGKARVIAHHTAFAPSVDVVVSRDYSDPTSPGVTVPGFSNPTSDAGAVISQINAQFRPGNWEVTLESGGGVAVDPTTIRLRPYSVTYIYAVGDFAGETLQYLVFVDGQSNRGGGRSRVGGQNVERRFSRF